MDMAKKDLLAHGSPVPGEYDKLSSIGSSGRHPEHASRDLMALVSVNFTPGLSLQMPLKSKKRPGFCWADQTIDAATLGLQLLAHSVS